MMTNNNANRRQFPAAFGGRGRPRGAPQPYRAYPPKRDEPVKKEEKKIDLTSEMNFPSLGKSDSSWTQVAALPGSIAAGGAGTSFAALATNWQESDNAEQERIEFEKMEAAREADEVNRFATIRRFATNSHCHVTSSRLYRHEDDEGDDEEDCDEHDYQQRERRAAESEWTTVDRMVKKGFQPQYADYEEEAGEEDYDY